MTQSALALFHLEHPAAFPKPPSPGFGLGPPPCVGISNSRAKGRRTRRISVTIDDALMSRALQLSGCRTQKSAIESGLRLLIQIHAQQRLRRLRGKVQWDGDLEEMRKD